MTPLWLEAHATYIDVHYSVTTHQITFVGDDVIRQAQRYTAKSRCYGNTKKV